MKITLENTSRIVQLVINGQTVPARIWQGQTENGIPVHAFITRIAPEIPKSDPRIDELTHEFEADLRRTADPRSEILNAIPLRFIL